MNKAFTLAETLITVVILGIVAAILVPNLIKNQVENANRTKVKKAMAAYEKAINMMIIENDIKSTEALRELGQDNCQYTREYFKTVQDGSNNCIFKTADRVWWDITDITNPIISLKDEITDSNKAVIRTNALNIDADKVSFALVGRFDDLGSLRVDDNGFEQSQANNINNRKYMAKLWGFVNNTTFSILSEFDICNQNNLTTCTIEVDGGTVTYTKVTTNTDTTVDTLGNGNAIDCIYDRNSDTRTCGGYTSIAPAGEYWISGNQGLITYEEAQDKTNSICNSDDCATKGDYYEAARRKCEAQGAHLPTLAEIAIANSNKMLRGAWYWSAEASSPRWAYRMNHNGDVYDWSYASSTGNVVCVGN